jgi:hypothetical protein
MKIKKGFVLEEVADSYLACATGKLAKSFSGFVRLNATGAFLWRELTSGDKTVEDLAAALVGEYEVDEATAMRDASIFVENLRAADILDG